MTTNAIRMSGRELPKNWANASSPPAEEPMPTMGKGRYADCEGIVRFEAVLTDRCFARFDLPRFFIVGILSRCPLPASVRSQGNSITQDLSSNDGGKWPRSEEHTSELQSLTNLLCR